MNKVLLILASFSTIMSFALWQRIDKLEVQLESRLQHTYAWVNSWGEYVGAVEETMRARDDILAEKLLYIIENR